MAPFSQESSLPIDLFKGRTLLRVDSFLPGWAGSRVVDVSLSFGCQLIMHLLSSDLVDVPGIEHVLSRFLVAGLLNIVQGFSSKLVSLLDELLEPFSFQVAKVIKVVLENDAVV